MSQNTELLVAGFEVEALYRKYDTELRELARRLRSTYHQMQKKRHGTTFGDVEGELMYLLLREMKPATAFEISPDCGWSTNYLLAALTANQHGALHSYELEPYKHGRPTETVIRGNQHPDWDQRRLTVHLGDARDTSHKVEGPINFLLLDSCHEDWFAKWYVDELFPRVHGAIMLHDIVFLDGLEPSSEARWFWDWAQGKGIRLSMTGLVEEALRDGLRTSYAERRSYRCNSVVLSWPNLDHGPLPELQPSPERLLEQAQEMTGPGADELATQAVRQILTHPERANRHRLLYRAGEIFQKLGEKEEAVRQWQRAVGVTLEDDPLQRGKGLSELFRLFTRDHHWRQVLATGLLLGILRDGLFSALGAGLKSMWNKVKARSKS